MDGTEILRLVDTIHRDKEIDKEIIFLGIEAALQSAVRKKFGESELQNRSTSYPSKFQRHSGLGNLGGPLPKTCRQPPINRDSPAQ